MYELWVDVYFDLVFCFGDEDVDDISNVVYDIGVYIECFGSFWSFDQCCISVVDIVYVIEVVFYIEIVKFDYCSVVDEVIDDFWNEILCFLVGIGIVEGLCDDQLQLVFLQVSIYFYC